MRPGHIFLVILFAASFAGHSQIFSPAPYCSGPYTSGSCLQGGSTNNPGNGVNDFIHNFITSGGNANISNTNSGCNMGPNNYAFYCSSFLSVAPNQVITCSVQSGITFAQGFSMWIDWNADNTFQHPGEQVAATSNFPAAAQWTTMTFAVPTVPAGAYRLRIRCAYLTAGTAITPCGTFSHGETEDYVVFVGGVPNNSGPVTATVAATPGTVFCSGQNLTFSVTSNYTSGLTYTWTGPSNFTSSAQNPTIAAAQPSNSGVYTVVASNSLCPDTKTIQVNVVGYPQYILTPPSPTLCNGGQTFVNAQFGQGVNPLSYNFSWAPTTGAGTVFTAAAPGTWLKPLTLPASQSVSTVQYSVTVTSTALNCPVTKVTTVTIYNPFNPTLTLSPPLCNTSQQYQFSANPPGGFWSASGVSGGGLLTPSLAAIGTNTVTYSVSVGGCTASNNGTFSISRFHTPALTSSLNMVCEKDPVYNLMNLVQDTVTGRWSGPGVTQFRYFSPAGRSTGIYTFTYNTWSTPVPSVCPSSTILAVSLFNPPIPTITAIAPRCNNAATLQLTAFPPGGTWSGGALTVSGLLTPSLAGIGSNNMVSYTAGQGTCQASSSRTFHISHFNTAAIPGSLPDLCFNSKPVSLMSVAQNTSGAWFGVNVQNNKFDPIGLATGIYTLTYLTQSFPDPLLCPDSSRITVSVLNPPSPVIAQAGPFCSRDASVQLQVTPGSGRWTHSQYLTPSGVFIPSLAPVGIVAAGYVVGTATCNTQSKINISVENFVPATLLQDRIDDVCNTSAAVNLQQYSTHGSGTWQGPGLQGSWFNPVLSGPGHFALEYRTSSIPSGLCPDQSTLSVTVFSLTPPAIIAGGPYCSSNAPVQVTVSPVGGRFEGLNSNAITSSGLFRPSDAPTGINLLSYSITSGPCIAYSQTTVMVERFVSAAMNSGAELAFCRTSPPFNLHHLAVNPGYSWTGLATDANGMFDPAKANIGENVLTYHTHSSPTSNLCPDQHTIRIRVDEIPEIAPVSTQYTGCAPLKVELTVPDISGGNGEWFVGDGSPHLRQLHASHTFTSSGTYSVAFNYTSGACHTSTSLPAPIRVLESPRADFAFSRPELVISDAQVDLVNKSTVTGNNRYLWDIESIGHLSDINPVITFPAAGRYSVTLKATSFDGCTDKITRFIEVRNDFHVYIPNSFTPNFDRMNDVFTPVFSPYGLDQRSYTMEIFDRWGHQLFLTTELDKGWNGTFQNKGDQLLKEGSYVYRIRFRDLEGKAHSRTGTVLLLKGL